MLSKRSTAPSLYLPIHMTDTEVESDFSHVSIREMGEVIAAGALEIGRGACSWRIPKTAPAAARRTAAIYERGFRRLVSAHRRHPVLRSAMRDISSAQLRIEFAAHNDRVVRLYPASGRSARPVLVVDASWAEADPSDGAVHFAGILLLGTLSLLARRTDQRRAMHRVFDLYSLLDRQEQKALQEFLRSAAVDCGHVFANAFLCVNNTALAAEQSDLDIEELSHVPTEALFDSGYALDRARFSKAGPSLRQAVSRLCRDAGAEGLAVAHAGESPEAFAERVLTTVEKTLKWRDKWATWMRMQDRLDFPYPQDYILDLLGQQFDDLDVKRSTVNQEVSKYYDFDTEGENINRISAWASERGIRLVAGRLSRAFSNQAHLLSTAAYLRDKASLVRLAARLERESRGADELHTAAIRVLHLVQEQKRTPYARAVGALNAFDNTVVAWQAKISRVILDEADQSSRQLLAATAIDLSRQRLGNHAKLAQRLLSLSAQLRKQLDECDVDPAAFVVQLQRLHPGESINLANANAFREVHTGKEEDLKDLLRLGGDYIYSAPGPGRYRRDGEVVEAHWILEVSDWIEAIPLFIKERIIRREVRSGSEVTEVESTQTEVDQEAMEAFFRSHAEFWARNLDAVMESERLSLARQLLIDDDPRLCRAADRLLVDDPSIDREEAVYRVAMTRPDLATAIAQLAVLVTLSEDALISTIHRVVEVDGVSRRQALRQVLCAGGRPQKGNLVGAALRQKGRLDAAVARAFERRPAKQRLQAARLESIAMRRVRAVSSLHVLTTESAGMTEGYVQTWLEEEMALFNTVSAHGLEAEVRTEVDTYRRRLYEIGSRVIDDLGMGVIVEEVMADERYSRQLAVAAVVSSYRPVAEQVGILGSLLEVADVDDAGLDTVPIRDPSCVEQYLEAHRLELEGAAVAEVAASNGRAFEERVEAVQGLGPELTLDEARRAVIDSEDDYREEWHSCMRCRAREKALAEMDGERPELKLAPRAGSFVRTYSQLARSSARKAVIARHGLQGATTHPRFYYQAAGANKRYHLLYTPSRVNLGHRERDSVVRWSQWVGGADAAAAQAGFEFYSLVNEGGVEERPALAYPEIEKTAENGLTVNHFAGSNALGLLCMAVLEGDVQDMADQMNLREDRYVPPAGEGYGGYCVPKDGLFLAFVLSLTNAVKLRQIGVPDHLHEEVMRLARKALIHQGDFETELDWQQWAAEKLVGYDGIEEHIGQRGERLVFHITKIARALQNLGRPWYQTASGDRLIANLAADWAVQKMIVHAEQVNRFMVFYKAWAIYDALRQAREKHPACPPDGEARIAVTAEYKPVQDVRFSTGLRLLEIFAGTGEHLHYALDEEGQNLVHLMFEGFDPDTEHPVGRRAVRQVLEALRLSEDDGEALERLRAAFPGHPPPGDVVVTSVTQSSIRDLLFYTSDARLDEIANRVQVQLGDYGLSEDQIRANAEVYGGNLRRWAVFSQRPPEAIQDVLDRVGGGIHALVLKLRGPGRDYELDVQGIDVLNTGIPFSRLLDLVGDPPKLVALMLEGHPNSALAITDGCAGREPRAFTDYDIQAFFAACERAGRRGTYIGVGLGQRNVERLEEEMRVWRRRGQQLLEAVVAVAQSSRAERAASITVALAVYDEIRRAVLAGDEAGKALRTEQRARRYGKWTARDSYVSQARVKVASGLPLSQLDTGTWLAGLGGGLALTGEGRARIDELTDAFQEGVRRIAAARRRTAPALAVPFPAADIAAIRAALVRPAHEPDATGFSQQKLVESSSKAVEVAAVEALERRRALRVRAEMARALADRESGFRQILDSGEGKGALRSEGEARKVMAELLERVEAFDPRAESAAEDRASVHTLFGHLIAHTRICLHGLAEDLFRGDDSRLKSFGDHLDRIFAGREIVLEDWKQLAGGYEDIGDLARLANLAAGDPLKRDAVAAAMELFNVTFALAQTVQFALDEPEHIDARVLYKNLTDFFAETINDHWYQYTPWCFDRGTAFSELSDQERYRLAVKHHRWLYRYVRTVLVRCTDLRDLPRDELDALLGRIEGDRAIAGIGAGGDSEVELCWRAYNQLREICFMRSDGFPTPPVFPEFDPALIEADTRVNVAFIYPVGRTHVSRALREAPTLHAELVGDGRRGANLLITHHAEVTRFPGARRDQLAIRDAHFYVDRGTFVAALVRHRGLSRSAAEKRAEELARLGVLTPKGIRIAARFSRNGEAALVQVSSVIPFHGLPLYESGRTEDLGLPATIQSLVFTDITYDKSLYPQIFDRESGVLMPPEIDWKQAYGSGRDEGAVKRLIAAGISRNGYVGLERFAREHPIVLIKGAAESGARNLKVFDLHDDAGRVKPEALQEAVDFLYDVSRRQSVVVQAAILTSPEFWAGPELMHSFVERQILDWNTAVSRDRLPRSQIFGSLRIIATSSHPDQPYQMAFPIILSSLQVATNVGRGGTLEKLLDDFVQEEFRSQIRPGLEREADKVMKAMVRFAAAYEPVFRAARGRGIGRDARGVSYAWSPYLMLDFLVSPVFDRPGRLVDIQPVYDASGRRLGSTPILQDESGRSAAGIESWQFIHLEPNVGIGLWDRFNLREEVLEERASRRQGRAFDWGNVGTSDRTVLRNIVIAGEQYLDAVRGE